MPIFKSELTGKSLCLKCLHQLNMSGEDSGIPKGAIQCLKCRTIDAFICHYGKVKAVFVYTGLSQDGTAIYTINHVNGNWVRGGRPTKIICGKCIADVPYWMLEMNRYVRATRISI